ncbi:MAG: LysM peptidoglycan-binding domain-containing protein [Candidatus Omnitrophica bacterium]|nr:LysM peptidoglycan-binding domain-containing protein [Candidatus Omnitrophota bacterium]MDD5591667.1 LysM peptidoglycan-binding domain-containing protein [Candidatus Omnitrophota bacterium]
MKLRLTAYGLRLTMVILFLSFILSGCVVRTYPLTRDRVDQDLASGNRGYLAGQAPYGEEKGKKTTRTTQVVEMELHSPIKFERMPKPKSTPEKVAEEETVQDSALWGNRGYLTKNAAMEALEAPAANVEKYQVQKGDTLQKISKKFYGTTKKWQAIYEANKDKLKGPNKIYPGQIIDVPANNLKQGASSEPLKETPENLK